MRPAAQVFLVECEIRSPN